MNDEIRDMLRKKKQELYSWKKQLEKSLSDAPEGRLCRSNSNGYMQYYVRGRTPEGKIKKRYVKNEEKHIISAIAQRDYEMKMLWEVECEIRSIDQFLSAFSPELLTQIYDDQPVDRKNLICPLIEPIEEYVKKWQNDWYTGLDFSQGQQEIFTERGERVRSKSEKIIADSLYRHGIPYHYEYPVYLRGMGTVYPDFICLHVRKRKEILWEHMGLMADPAYCKKALKKEEMYIKNGYRTGIDIIYTRESTDYTISTKVIDRIIKDTFG